MFKFLEKLLGKTSVNYRQLLRQGAIIIDVRTPAEYREGHIKESINIPLDTIRSKVQEIKSKNKPVITVCRSGNRSAVAKSILKSAGIEAYNGGGWQSLLAKLNG
ncbi:MAG: rhodanese-like domain-containing protein [Chitinophagaceae bacterium]|nr:rhodanese-like domain-containing protein [Chitinophagaceae bacterium]